MKGMKNLLLLPVCLALVAAACARERISGWNRIMTDSGMADTLWVMTADHAGWQRKNLELPVPVSEIREAVIEYEIQTHPYDSRLKLPVKTSSEIWGNWQIRINDKLVLDKPAADYISRKIHRIPVSPALLKEGRNCISMGWRKLTAGEKSMGKQYGYVYFAIDHCKDAYKRRKNPAAYEDILHIRLLIR